MMPSTGVIMEARQKPRMRVALQEETIWDYVTILIFASLLLLIWWALAVK